MRSSVPGLDQEGGVGQVPIARFVGHKVGTLAGDTYSAGGAKENAVATAGSIRYGVAVEAAATALGKALESSPATD